MVGQVGDGHDILVALAGKAHHKVELHAVPTSLEGRLGRTVQSSSVTFLLMMSRMR